MSLRSIYRKIAKKHDVSVAEVIQEMQAAIDQAYLRLNQSEREKAKQNSLPCQGERPTPEELIQHVAKTVREKIK